MGKPRGYNWIIWFSRLKWLCFTIGGGGSHFTAYTTLTSTSASSTFTITSGGTGYVVGDTLNFNYNGTGGGSGVIETLATVSSSGVITGITLTNACSGFTLKAPTITSITSSAGTGAVITCS